MAPSLNEAGSFITVETDETMGIDMTLRFRTLAHIEGNFFSVWDWSQLPHTITAIV